MPSQTQLIAEVLDEVEEAFFLPPVENAEFVLFELPKKLGVIG
jgi:hypothetical protein